jgi:hypothetical protein
LQHPIVGIEEAKAKVFERCRHLRIVYTVIMDGG